MCLLLEPPGICPIKNLNLSPALTARSSSDHLDADSSEIPLVNFSISQSSTIELPDDMMACCLATKISRQPSGFPGSKLSQSQQQITRCLHPGRLYTTNVLHEAKFCSDIVVVQFSSEYCKDKCSVLSEVPKVAFPFPSCMPRCKQLCFSRPRKVYESFYHAILISCHFLAVFIELYH